MSDRTQELLPRSEAAALKGEISSLQKNLSNLNNLGNLMGKTRPKDQPKTLKKITS